MGKPPVWLLVFLCIPRGLAWSFDRDGDRLALASPALAGVRSQSVLIGGAPLSACHSPGHPERLTENDSALPPAVQDLAAAPADGQIAVGHLDLKCHRFTPGAGRTTCCPCLVHIAANDVEDAARQTGQGDSNRRSMYSRSRTTDGPNAERWQQCSGLP